jgi:hypothetical protein
MSRIDRNKKTGVASVEVNGRRITLADLPLVAYSLECGHVGRDRAIQAGDRLFCETCGDTRRVARLISQ